MIDKEVSKLKVVFYYFSFVLLYTALTFLSSLFLFDYEKNMSDWAIIPNGHRAAYILYYLLQFPFGDIIALVTGKDPHIIFMFLVNPLFVAWASSTVVVKCNYTLMQRIAIINCFLCVVIVVSVLIYLASLTQLH